MAAAFLKACHGTYTGQTAGDSQAKTLAIFVAQYSLGFLVCCREVLTQKDANTRRIVLYHVLMSAGCALAGGAHFATFFPERLAPGWCDAIGSSHNVMHVWVAFSIYYAHRGISRWLAAHRAIRRRLQGVKRL